VGEQPDLRGSAVVAQRRTGGTTRVSRDRVRRRALSARMRQSDRDGRGGVQYWQAIAFTEVDQLVDVARAAEDLGFTGILVPDHVVNPVAVSSPYPYAADGKAMWDPTMSFPDAWTLVATLAASTTTLRFATYVYILPMREPFAVAKTVGTTALLCGNRVALGVGTGWMKEEFDLLGQSFADRGPRTDEMLAIIRALWSGEVVEHHGEFYDFGPVQMAPVPERQVPIWVGGHSKPALRRAVGADGWMGVNYEIDHAVAVLGALRDARAADGDHRDDYEVILALDASPTEAEITKLEGLGVTGLVKQPWIMSGVATSSLQYKVDDMATFASRYIG
jgi:probable F420-dependent oxidoreductase